MHPNVPQCQYIKTNGLRCGSPALRRQRFCYFHYEVNRPTIGFGIPALEDANAIQVALTDVARAVADERLDLKRATVLGYILQTASANLKRVVLGMPTSITELPEPVYPEGATDDQDAAPDSIADEDRVEAGDAARTDSDHDFQIEDDSLTVEDPAAPPLSLPSLERQGGKRNAARVEAGDPARNLNETRKKAVRAFRDAEADIRVAFATRKRGS